MPRWFRRKRFGYGWTPANWQGWVVTLAFVLVIIGLSEPRWFTMEMHDRLALILTLTVGFIALAAFTSGNDSDA
jgi:hypothetical protein